MTPAEFLKLVDRSGGPDACWPWTGSMAKLPHVKAQYGTAYIFGKTHRAHRVAFYLHNGHWPTPGGLHHCDNPPCCNPAHIYEGTHAQNMADCVARGRHVSLSGDQHWTHLHPERRTRGERHGQAKVTEDDVRKIRSQPHRSQRSLASELNISHIAVGFIRRGETWGHVR